MNKFRVRGKLKMQLMVSDESIIRLVILLQDAGTKNEDHGLRLEEWNQIRKDTDAHEENAKRGEASLLEWEEHNHEVFFENSHRVWVLIPVI